MRLTQSARAWRLGQLAKALDVAGRLEEAEVAYREAIRRGEEGSLVDLADMILVDPSRHQEAEELLTRAGRADQPMAPYVLGNLLARQPGREAEPWPPSGQ